MDRKHFKAMKTKIARFLRKYLQCSFGVHWVSVSCVGSEHTCPDCGKYFPALVLAKEVVL